MTPVERSEAAFDRVMALAPRPARLVTLGRHLWWLAGAVLWTAIALLAAFDTGEDRLTRVIVAAPEIAMAAYAWSAPWIADARSLAKSNRALREALTTAALLAGQHERWGEPPARTETEVN